MRPSWTSEKKSKAHVKNDNGEAFDTNCDEVLSTVTDRPTDNILESLYKMQVEWKSLLQVYPQETTFGDKKYDYCRMKLMAQRDLEQNIKDSHFKAINRDKDRPATGAPNEGKAEGKGKIKCQK